MVGGQGRATIDGGAGDDTIRVRGDDNVVNAGTGNDTIVVAGGHRTRISCGPGRDRVVADRTDLVGRDCEQVRRR